MWPFRKRRPRAPRPDLAVVGLGNPGPDYAGTRHNVGFMCVDHFASSHGIDWTGRRGPLTWAEGQVSIGDASKGVLLAKPRTFMNLSGEAVRYIRSRWHTQVEDLLIIYDDMDLPLGSIRLRAGGSAGGHKGIRSIIEALGTEDVPRIRVGIGRDVSGRQDAIDYVLSEFTEEEKQALKKVTATVSEALLCALAEGIETAMNRFN